MLSFTERASHNYRVVKHLNVIRLDGKRASTRGKPGWQKSCTLRACRFSAVSTSIVARFDRHATVSMLKACTGAAVSDCV